MVRHPGEGSSNILKKHPIPFHSIILRQPISFPKQQIFWENINHFNLWSFVAARRGWRPGGQAEEREKRNITTANCALRNQIQTKEDPFALLNTHPPVRNGPVTTSLFLLCFRFREISRLVSFYKIAFPQRRDTARNTRDCSLRSSSLNWKIRRNWNVKYIGSTST